MEVLLDTVDKLANSSRVQPEGRIASQRRSDGEGGEKVQVLQGPQDLPRPHDIPEVSTGGDFDDDKG